MPPPEKQPPRPKPKPPKPNPKPKIGPKQKPVPTKPRPEPVRDGTSGVVPFPPQLSCETYRRCPPPPAPPATVHLRSGRLPNPLLALSASLLAVSALLLLALFIYRQVRRRREGQNAPHDEESAQGVAAVAGELGEEEEDVDGGVHHAWYIQTKGLDERAIAAIAAVVYDATKMKERGGDGDGGCAVCLAEFRDGETLRLLPRCGHAFHVACIDTWLRARVNCPLCRAPVQVATAAPGTTTRPRGEAAEANPSAVGGAQTEETAPGVLPPERAVRRAASMVALPRLAWQRGSVRSGGC